MNESFRDREYYCDICGFQITARQGWHHSYEGMNHWTCEMIQARRKSGFHTADLPVRKVLYAKLDRAQPVVNSKAKRADEYLEF